MDLKAANLADDRASRMTRIGMIVCFSFASVMLLASLAMANGFSLPH
jgi:hypothetical protein